MKKKITIGIILFMIIITLLSGCFETSNSIHADISDIYYSDDNNTVLVDCSHMSPNRIVNIINDMYDNGYKYIGDVQTPWNMAGRFDFYLIFRIDDDKI